MNNIIIGIRRYPKRFLLSLFFGYVTLWAFLEPILVVFELKLNGFGWPYFTLYFLISLIIALVNIWPKKKVEFELKNTNTKIIIEFGDLFQFDGNKVISMTEYFDTEIGKPVSKNSLHGYFIEKILGGHTEIIDKSINEQLDYINPEKAPKSSGKQERYPIGTSIYLDHSNTRYFLFAMSSADKDCKAFATPASMLSGLDGLWNEVRRHGNGDVINVPLIGSGLSGVGLPSTQIIQLILISILNFVKSHELSTVVRIVLLENTFRNVDLNLIKNNWN